MTFGVEGGVPRALSIKERCLLNCLHETRKGIVLLLREAENREGRAGGGQGGGGEGVQPRCNSREMSAIRWNPLRYEQIFGKCTK